MTTNDLKTFTTFKRLLHPLLVLAVAAVVLVTPQPASAFSGSGAMHVQRLEDGVTGPLIEDRDWTAGWTHAKSFSVGAQSYVATYKSGDGRLFITSVKNDGHLGATVIDTTIYRNQADIAVVVMSNGVFVIATEPSSPGVLPWGHIYNLDITAKKLTLKRHQRTTFDSITSTFSNGTSTAVMVSVGRATSNLMSTLITVQDDSISMLTLVASQPVEAGSTHVQLLGRGRRVAAIVYNAATGNATWRWVEPVTGKLYNSSPVANLGKGWTVFEPYSDQFDSWLFMANATTGAARVDRLAWNGLASVEDLFTRTTTFRDTWTLGWTVGEVMMLELGWSPTLMIIKSA